MGMSRLGGVAAVVAGVLAMTACGENPQPLSTPTAQPTPDSGSPDGAMAGFLKAVTSGDNTQVGQWLATSADANDLTEVVKVYGSFGALSQDGVYWPVSGVQVAGVTVIDSTHAQVALTDDIVWCLGAAVNDPSATCEAVNGISGAKHTYAALSVKGRWKVDVDINNSSQLDHNPQGSPTATAPTPTPAP